VTAEQGSPKYVRAADLVRARIADGTLRPGEPAPSGAALAAVTGYSDLTCRRALRVLVQDGTLAPGPSPRARFRVPVPASSPDGQALAGAALALSAGLVSRRRAAGLTQPALAALADCSVTTVGHAETGRLWQGRDFWERADKVLCADGELLCLHDAWRAATVAVADRAEITGAVSGGGQDLASLLTADERQAVRQAGLLYTLIAENVVADGPTRDADLAELRAAVHLIQRTVLAQGAARAFPQEFRLLGTVIRKKRE
jgi:Helix-turn-helix domain/Bacterial regulatory proteins, gntR family